MNPLTRKIAGLAVGLTLAAASVIALSPSASAATLTYPVSATVNIRSTANSTISTNIVGTAAAWTYQTFNCYVTGTSVGGDNVWGHLSNGKGYISDYYISAGGKTLAQLGLNACAPTTTTPPPSAPSAPTTVQARINSAVAWAVAIANDNTHGYSQASRQGPNYDCSSLVSNAYAQAGTGVSKYDWTGSMLADYKAHGFTAYAFSGFNLANLRPGDVLLNVSAHTEMVYTNVSGKITMVAAHSDRGHPETGDQTGTEINTSPYWYDSWDYVLRYTG